MELLSAQKPFNAAETVKIKTSFEVFMMAGLFNVWTRREFQECLDRPGFARRWRRRGLANLAAPRRRSCPGRPRRVGDLCRRRRASRRWCCRWPGACKFAALEQNDKIPANPF